MQEMWVRSLNREDPLNKEMPTHSSILAWEMAWTEEPGGLQSQKESDTTWWPNNNSLKKKTMYLLKILQKVPNRDLEPKQMRSCFSFPWVKWGQCTQELRNRWPHNVYRCVSIVISLVVGWLDGARGSRALETAEAYGPAIFGHMQPCPLAPACVPYKYFMCCNVGKKADTLLCQQRSV